MRHKDAPFQSCVAFWRRPSGDKYLSVLPGKASQPSVELCPIGRVRAPGHLCSCLQPPRTKATSKAHGESCPKIARKFVDYFEQWKSPARGGELLSRSPPRHEPARAALC